MFIRLLLLFTIVPIIELYLLIKIGEEIGALTTIIIIIATGTVGAYLAKSQGLKVYSNVKNTIKEGRMPGNELLHGLFVLVGGALLLTPGIITDILGFSFIIPGARAFYATFAKEYIRKKIKR